MDVALRMVPVTSFVGATSIRAYSAILPRARSIGRVKKGIMCLYAPKWIRARQGGPQSRSVGGPRSQRANGKRANIGHSYAALKRKQGSYTALGITPSLVSLQVGRILPQPSARSVLRTLQRKTIVPRTVLELSGCLLTPVGPPSLLEVLPQAPIRTSESRPQCLSRVASQKGAASRFVGENRRSRSSEHQEAIQLFPPKV